jgi:Mg-chelatase subunit ChlD
MTDWAASSGGVYRYANSKADIEDAFDHLASWLRRPAGYRLTVTTSAEELEPPEPGRLAVTAPTDAAGSEGVVLAGDAAVGVILDTSGTMLELSRGERRIDVAKRVLVDLFGRDLPAGTRVALRAFGSRCTSDLLVPLGPLDPPAAISSILDRQVRKKTPTPLAATIEEIVRDLTGTGGPSVVVVLTDGARDNCDGNPEETIRTMRESGVDLRVNVVGFELDRRDRGTSARLAEVGGGAYFDARNGDELGAALKAAVSAPFRVVDAAGAVVAEGTVGGEPVSLPTGTYVVDVAVEPVVRFDEVFVAPGGRVELSLPASEEAAAAE